MNRNWTHNERTAAGMIALLVAVTFAVQTFANADRDGSALAAFLLLFRYFTIWTNFATGIVMGLIALGRRLPSYVPFSLASALSVVGLVYHALLAADHHPVGLEWWTNLAFHTIIPVAGISWWLVATRAQAHGWRALPCAMIAPIIYTGFALLYGAASGFYPYFFLDRSSLGWPQLLLNIAGLSLFFLFMGTILMGLRSAFARLL